MNQPASKEPTMDEILSSIRQIIADDDENVSQKQKTPEPAPEPVSARKAETRLEAAPEPNPAEQVIDPFSDDDDDDAVPPLALSPEQIIADEDEAATFSPAAVKAEPVDAESELEQVDEMPSAASLKAAADLVVPDDVAFDDREDVAPPTSEKPAAGFAQSAPMPDPDLSADMADELLEPATQAAVRNAFSKLNTPRLTPEMPLGASGLTIEAMIREMLRPMLKEWLEENLPSMVERIVAQEIERASRGE